MLDLAQTHKRLPRAPLACTSPSLQHGDAIRVTSSQQP